MEVDWLDVKLSQGASKAKNYGEKKDLVFLRMLQMDFCNSAAQQMVSIKIKGEKYFFRFILKPALLFCVIFQNSEVSRYYHDTDSLCMSAGTERVYLYSIADL